MKNVRYVALALLIICFAGCAKNEDGLWDYSECRVDNVVVTVETTKATLDVYFTRPSYSVIEFSLREEGDSVWNDGNYILHNSIYGYVQTVEVQNLTPATTYEYVIKYTSVNYHSPYNMEVGLQEYCGGFTTLALGEMYDETNCDRI